MGHTSSKLADSPIQAQPVAVPQIAEPTAAQGFARAQTMLDVSQAQLAAGDAAPGLQRSNSDTALNTSTNGSSKSYQRALEWGRNEHFFKLAHTFHTNNY